MSDIPYPTPFTSTWRRRAYAQVAQERIDAGKVDRTDVALISELFRKPFRYVALGCGLGLLSSVPLLRLCSPYNRSRWFRLPLRVGTMAAGIHVGTYIGFTRTFEHHGRTFNKHECERIWGISEDLFERTGERVRRERAEEWRSSKEQQGRERRAEA